MKVLVVDIGGTHVKLLASGRRVARRIDSGPRLTPRQLGRGVLAETEGWSYDVVSIGYPGPCAANRPEKEPVHLGRGWVRFDFESAFGRPVRIVNDAAMQAIGSYAGGKMLFLGLGTGLGTTLLRSSVVVPLELAHLPYRDDGSFEDYVGEAGRRRLGNPGWRRHVGKVAELLIDATVADYAVLGGGNVHHLNQLPPRTRRGDNANAFRGGFRLWREETQWT